MSLEEKQVTCAFCGFDCSVTIGKSGKELAFHYRLWPNQDDSFDPPSPKNGDPISEVCYGSNNPVPKNPVEFTAEEQKDLRVWAKEREKRRKIWEDYDAQKIHSSKDLIKPEGLIKLARDLADSSPDRCEHDRSIWSNCLTCFELEEKLCLLFGIEKDEEE